MAITIQTKTIPNTQRVFKKSLGYKKTFEDRQNDWIKNNLGIKE